MCFIASACCGSSQAPEVVALRAFRDRSLLSHRAGRAFVAGYYRVSPRPARFIGRHERLRSAVRFAVIRPLARLAAQIAD
jgi:hypothetical protein